MTTAPGPIAANIGDPSPDAGDSEVYLARQPIFDAQRRVVGYKLLHRSSAVNAFDPKRLEHATAELVEHSLLQWGLDQLLEGKVGHIRVDAGFLLHGLHDTLPPDRVVLEFAEDVDLEGDHKFAYVDARIAGFKLALGDMFARTVLPRSDLLRLADIIKLNVSAAPLDVVAVALGRLREQAPQARFMAVRVEERAQFDACSEMGFDLFEGFFFAKPEVLTRKARNVASTAAITLLVEVQRPDMTIKRLEQLVVADPTLAFRLLTVVNSSAVGLAARVESVYQALVLLGIERVRQLATLIAIATRAKGNEELLMVAATRAHMARELSTNQDLKQAAYTTGMLSVIDVLFSTPMNDLLEELPLSEVVIDALRDRTGPIGELLRAIEAYERGDLDTLEQLRPGARPLFISAYQEGALAAQMIKPQLVGGL